MTTTRPAPQVRPATEADLPAILDIYNEAVLHTTASYDLEPVSLASRAAWFAEKRARGHPVLVAVRGGEVVGWSAYGPFRSKEGYRFSAEHSVYVAASARGQGVGRALLEPLIGLAREAGLHLLVGGVDASNAASLGLHASLGFTLMGTLPQAGHKFGRWLDLSFVGLHLQQDRQLGPDLQPEPEPAPT